MFSLFSGQRPDITPAQLGAFIIGGIPVLSKLLAAFGLWDPSAEQEQALTDAVQWGIVGGGALILGDAGLRAARNQADSRRDAAALSSGAEPHDALVDEIPDDELPSDEQEGLEPAAVQPSQTEPGR